MSRLGARVFRLALLSTAISASCGSDTNPPNTPTPPPRPTAGSLAPISSGTGAVATPVSGTGAVASAGTGVPPRAGSGAAGTGLVTAGGMAVSAGGAGGGGALVAGGGGGGGTGSAIAGTGAAGSAGASGANAAAGSGGAGGGSGTPTTEPCTGKPGKTGNDTRTYAAEGANYIVHFPSGLEPNTPVPLVIVAHGFTMSGGIMQALTGFDRVSDANKFVVVYPDGDGGATPWNVGSGACAPGSIVDAPFAQSLDYIKAIKTSVEQDQCIDAKKVFVTGFSMGGYFSHNVGCQIGNSFARAVGPHSGGTYPGDCPGAPLPIFIMHGDADTFIDYRLCGQAARDLWLTRNKCSMEKETREVMGGSCDWYKGCDANGQTVFCSFRGVGHSWAGGATDAVWNFFKMYL